MAPAIIGKKQGGRYDGSRNMCNLATMLVIDNGNIAETGSHEELVLKNGLYKRLWDIQTGVVVD